MAPPPGTKPMKRDDDLDTLFSVQGKVRGLWVQCSAALCALCPVCSMGSPGGAPW